MTVRTNKALELARMMIKQAKMLKGAGFATEARTLARRAIEINTMGHHALRVQAEPVRVSRPRG